LFGAVALLFASDSDKKLRAFISCFNYSGKLNRGNLVVKFYYNWSDLIAEYPSL